MAVVKEIKGWHVFAVTASAFAVIIGVNVFMASQAIRTFPGLETKNSYVASQHFNNDRAAQLALGWDVSAKVEGERLILSINDKEGHPVQPQSIQATLGRATHDNSDTSPEFVFDGQAQVAQVSLAPGNWNLRLVAEAADGTQFRQRIPLYVKR